MYCWVPLLFILFFPLASCQLGPGAAAISTVTSVTSSAATAQRTSLSAVSGASSRSTVSSTTRIISAASNAASTSAVSIATTSGGGQFNPPKQVDTTPLIVCQNYWETNPDPKGTIRAIYIQSVPARWQLQAGSIIRQQNTNVSHWTELAFMYQASSTGGFPNFEILDLQVRWIELLCSQITNGISSWIPQDESTAPSVSTTLTQLGGAIKCLGNPDAFGTVSPAVHYVWIEFNSDGLNVFGTNSKRLAAGTPANLLENLPATLDNPSLYIIQRMFLQWVTMRCQFQYRAEWLVVHQVNLTAPTPTSSTIRCQVLNVPSAFRPSQTATSAPMLFSTYYTLTSNFWILYAITTYSGLAPNTPIELARVARTGDFQDQWKISELRFEWMQSICSLNDQGLMRICPPGLCDFF